MSVPVLPNAHARRVFLDRHALSDPPTGTGKGANLHALIDRIGFVQVDSINTVARAHHMILFARRQTYKPAALSQLLETDRTLWEHWTHDASILPISVFGHWKHRFTADRARLVARWTGWQRDGFAGKFDSVLQQISDHGPVSSSDVGEGEARGSGGWWDWHPSKAALEFLWRTGEIAVTRRIGFRKVYDLTERVLPALQCAPEPDLATSTDWACRSAFDRLGFATSGEIAAYWNLVPPGTAKAWCAAALARSELIEVIVTAVDGTPRRSYAQPSVLDMPRDPPSCIRILSPFDPALRDRHRAERLFGFDYRIEIYVPERLRKYGYYVFPVLEGARLIGRIDAKAWRDDGAFRVRGFWPEAGVVMGAGRLAKLQMAVEKIAAFAGSDRVEYLEGWCRT